MKNAIKTIKINTPLGEMVAGATREGICLLEFSDRRTLPKELKDLENYLAIPVIEGNSRHLRRLAKELKEYFKGKRKEFTVPLVTPGSEFQQAVWNEIRKIPFGTTRSYHEQAKKVKTPGSVRAVAHANGMNRISIVVPCHRVIGADGKLVGYGGGLKRKKWLLDHEKKYSGKAIDLDLFEL